MGSHILSDGIFAYNESHYKNEGYNVVKKSIRTATIDIEGNLHHIYRYVNLASIAVGFGLLKKSEAIGR
jgi:hypothetical protein